MLRIFVKDEQDSNDLASNVLHNDSNHIRENIVIQKMSNNSSEGSRLYPEDPRIQELYDWKQYIIRASSRELRD